MSGGCALSMARAMIAKLVSMKRFDSVLLSAVVPVGGEAGNVVYEMCVQREHTNALNTLHGGASAYLVDAVTTISQMTLDKPPGE